MTGGTLKEKNPTKKTMHESHDLYARVGLGERGFGFVWLWFLVLGSYTLTSRRLEVPGCCFSQPRTQGSSYNLVCDTGFQLWEKVVGGLCPDIINGNTDGTPIASTAKRAQKVENLQRCAKACGAEPTCKHFVFYKTAAG